MRFIGQQTLVMLILSLMPFAICLSKETSGPDLQIVEQKLKNLRPDLPIKDVYNSPVSGIIAIDLEGGTTLYVTDDAEYMFAGDLYSLSRGFSNETDKRRDKARREILSKEPLEDMIIFSPSNEVKTFVNIFTDVDCGYCRKFHSEIKGYLDLGIQVNYLAFPRTGLESDSSKKIVSAWCNDDPHSSITDLKLGKEIEYNLCSSNPVSEHFNLGQQLGISGTPSILTTEGRMIPGYVSPKELFELLNG